MSEGFTESVVEEAALAWLATLAYTIRYGPDIAAGMLEAERSDPNYRDMDGETIWLTQRQRVEVAERATTEDFLVVQTVGRSNAGIC